MLSSNIGSTAKKQLFKKPFSAPVKPKVCPDAKQETNETCTQTTKIARSMTDEEYEAIFKSAIDRAMNTPLDELMVTSSRKNDLKTGEKKEKRKVKLKIVKRKGKEGKAEVIIGKKREKDGKNPKPTKTEIVPSTSNSCEEHSVKLPVFKQKKSDTKPKIKCTAEKSLKNKNINVENRTKSVENNIEGNSETTVEDRTTAEGKVEILENETIGANYVKITEIKLLPEVQNEIIFQDPQLLNEITPENSESGETTKERKNSEVSCIAHKVKKIKTKEEKLKPKCLQFPVKLKLMKENKPVSQPDNSTQRKQKTMLERDYTSYGTWVQCCDQSCNKWRLLNDVDDPSVLPEKWYCSMNKDKEHNSCDKTEQDYDESEHIFTKFSEGSVVWAKMAGFPRWPAMVEMDPDLEYFFLLNSASSMHPSHYHVVFFDEKVSRAWIRAAYIQPFIGNENLDSHFTGKSKGPSYKKEIELAKNQAICALDIDVKDRLKQYGFGARYKGKWGSTVPENNATEKKTKKIKKDVKKKINNVGKVPRVEIIDDTTIDDLINNPNSSVLKKLEDALHDIESDILTEDSDFLASNDLDEDWEMTEKEPPINCTVSRNGRIKERNKKRKIEMEDFSDDEDNQILPIDQCKKKGSTEKSHKRANGQETCQLQKKNKENLMNSEVNTGTDITEEKNTFKVPIYFNSDIFTMEMDLDSENTEIQVQGSKKECEPFQAEVMEVTGDVLAEMKNEAEKHIYDTEFNTTGSNCLQEVKSTSTKENNCITENNTDVKSLKIMTEKTKSVEGDSSDTIQKKNLHGQKKTNPKKTIKIGSMKTKCSTSIENSESSHLNEKIRNDKKCTDIKKHSFVMPQATSSRENPNNKGYNFKKETFDFPLSPKLADAAESLDMSSQEVQGAKLENDMEQRVPGGEDEEDVQHYDEEEELSMELDIDPIHKRHSQDNIGHGQPVVSAQDEDSDPFELIEE